MRRALAQLRTQVSPLQPALRFSVWWQVGLFVVAAVAFPLDHRLILGLNPWIKPMKFDISVTIYAITIAALVRELTRSYAVKDAAPWRVRTLGRVVWGIAIAMIVEDSIITLQAFRGVRSHMNFTSLFNGISFGIMGVFILVNTIAVGALLALYMQHALQLTWPPAVVVGARLGLFTLLLGSIEGVVIVLHLQHTVGGPDSGAGLPFVNWSTVHGDLRVPHFFALHALQIFPVVGWLISRGPWRPRLQTMCVVAFAAAYIAGCGWLFHQAMRGRPLFGLG